MGGDLCSLYVIFEGRIWLAVEKEIESKSLAFCELTGSGTVLWVFSGSFLCEEHLVYVAVWDKWVLESSETKSRICAEWQKSSQIQYAVREVDFLNYFSVTT